MIYLGTPSSQDCRQAMSDGFIGQLVTPRSGDAVIPNTVWALDNGCFSPKWDVEKWQRGLKKYTSIPNCLFAVVPDVVGDSEKTDILWSQWSEIVEEHGFKPAYVLQNGCKSIPSNAGAIFTGGDNEWKLGVEAQNLVEIALGRGLWAHMGRVNSWRRFRYAADCGYNSVDGTYLAFGPDKNLPTVLKWVERIRSERTIFCDQKQ